MIYWIITGVAMLASKFVGSMLQKRFQEYSTIYLETGMTGREVAEKMLRDNGITDVEVMSVAGQLTDHYDPRNKTVNLSEVVYNETHVGAAAVAAHEVGHAVQHAKAYPFLQMRSSLVPVVNLSANWVQYVLMAGIGIYFASQNAIVLMIGIALFSFSTLFSFVTLPVEFDASARALKWLQSANITNNAEFGKAKNALWWAAMTYVVAALASLGQLLYYVSILLQNRD
ncbi:MAG: zinc metallopeptidase [Chitinophagales bacterium]